MSPIPAYQHRSSLALQVGTLALSPVRDPNPMGVVRAAAWHNHLLRLGLPLPLCLVHDLGLLITTGARPGKQRLPVTVPISPVLLNAYTELLDQLGQSELVCTATRWHLREPLIAVLLHRLLREIYLRWPAHRSWIKTEELPLDPGIYHEAEIERHFRDFDMSPVLSLLDHVVQHRLYLLTAIEQIDLDTLRLLGLFQSDHIRGAIDMADLLNVFSSPEANDVVNFSMELIPSVLETKRQSGAQAFSFDGLASLERHGSVDSIVLSELAYDQDLFERKMQDNELYYYGHELEREDERHLQYILVDSSASMRGVRQVFARGLALTLIKKLSLLGDEVWLRFFDSRLYPPIRIDENIEAAVPHLLCFSSERGRNYHRVFQQLLGELKHLQRSDHRSMALTILTHGQCHIGTALVEQLRQVAYLYGVFILPSSSLHLDYLPLLHRYQIVTAESFTNRESSVDRALEIIDDAATTHGRPR